MRKAWLALAVGALAVTTVVWAADELAVGSTAPDFTLKDLSGDEHSLSAHKEKAKAVVVVWVSKDCPVSKAYDKRMEALYKDFKDRGVAFFMVNSNKTETPEQMKAHLDANGLTYPVVWDSGGKVADAYQAQVTPEVFVLDSDLKVRYHGAVDNSQDPGKVAEDKQWARAAIAAVLDGKAPEPARTRQFGCGIKR
jgi:peroxiredoxin